MLRRAFLFALILLAGFLAGAPLRAQEESADPPAATAPPAAPPPQAAPAAKPPVRKASAKPAPKPAPRAAAAVPSWPPGASSVTEVYGDWTAICGTDNGSKTCSITQVQGNSQTGQRSFAVELKLPSDGKTEGTIVMPLGVQIEPGASLKLDDQALGESLRFYACVQQGCLLRISLPAAATDAMRKAQKLSVSAVRPGNAEAMTFNISLNGFGAALDRIGQLVR